MIAEFSLLQGTLLSVVVSIVAVIAYLEIKHSALRGIPGPFIARYTNAWRCYLAWKYSERPGGITYHEVIHEKYGDVVRVGPRTVFINDPAAIPVVLGFKDRLEKTDSVIPFMQPGKPTSIVGIRNEQKHAAYRRPIQGAYSLSSLKLYEPAIDDMINKLIAIFQDKCQSQTVINVTEWCHFFAYDTIMNITFGSPLGFLENAKDMYDLIANQVKHVAYVRVLTQWPALDYVLRTNPLVLAFKSHKESPFFRFAVQRIRQEMEKPTPDEIPKRTLLQHFVDAKSRYPEIVDDTQIRLYCATNALAGSLSPSRVLDCVLSWLAQHPIQQDRLYEEVMQNATKGFPVCLEDTANMPYLEGVIREGYRLHHGGDIAIERKVGSNGVTLPDGRVIPAGYDVAMSSPSVRVCSAFGEEPHVFKPDRWLMADGESIEEWKSRRAYMDRADLTFSQGSRACIGKSFTHLELFKVVASVLGQYKLELAGTPQRFVVPVKLAQRHHSTLTKDIYPGDRTVAAASRLRAQHNVSKTALGGLVFAPIDLQTPNLRILDCGTADGYWLYDLSKELDSSATLIGTDIASFPSDSFPKPGNVTLIIQSYKDPWPASWENSFDLVHMRFCVAGLADPTEAQLAIDRLINLVKPGGWIQLVDSTLPAEDSISAGDKPSMKLFKSMAHMLRSKGQDTNAGLRLGPLLVKSGKLSDVQTKKEVAKLGKGAATDELTKDGIFNLMKMVDTLKPKLDDMGQALITSTELEELRPQILQEAHSIGVDKPYFAAWGKRVI